MENNQTIKASELRIGNLVEGLGDTCMVSNIGQDYFYVSSIEGINYKSTWAEIKPIPLTEEWLLRMGFEKKGSEWILFPCCEIQIIVFNEGNYNGVMFYTRTIHTDYTPIYSANHINYIHQLQNLYYALTNQELEIKES